MDQAATKFFEENHDLIVNHAVKQYGLQKDSVKRLGSFESAVFEVCRDAKSYILRATDSEHRSVEQIQAELDWVAYLAANGVPVCQPLESIDNRLVEPLFPNNGDKRSFALILFEKAEGDRLKPEECTDNFVQRWGEVIGRMHSLTRAYKPGVNRRHHWYSDTDLIPANSIIESQPLVAERIDSQINEIRSLVENSTRYGLVHSDLHHGNFFIYNGNLKLFDTDDCHYDYFLNDLAMPLYYTFHDERIGHHSPEFARVFWRNLLAGYNRHFSVEKGMLENLPSFLKLREMILYMIIVKEAIAESDPWCRKFMAGRKERIEQSIPVIDLEFISM